MELAESGAEFVGAAIDGVPKVGDDAEPLLGIEFGLPVLVGGLIFESGEDLEGVGGNDG